MLLCAGPLLGAGRQLFFKKDPMSEAESEVKEKWREVVKIYIFSYK